MSTPAQERDIQARTVAGLTIERLRFLLHYDPATGHFVRQRTAGGQLPGTIAGNTRRDGYRTINIDGRSYYCQRLAWLWMTGNWPEVDIDHVNGCPSDNIWTNLRLATPSQNLANSRLAKNSSSGLKGVYFHRHTNKWCAGITHQGKKIYLGLFETPEAAHAAYAQTAQQLFGNFARLK